MLNNQKIKFVHFNFWFWISRFLWIISWFYINDWKKKIMNFARIRSCKFFIWTFIKWIRILNQSMFFKTIFFKTISTNSSSIKFRATIQKMTINNNQMLQSLFNLFQTYTKIIIFIHFFNSSRIMCNDRHFTNNLKTIASCSNDTSEKILICVMWKFDEIDKSQLIHNYVQQCRHDYSIIFWIEIEFKKSIEGEFIQIYRLLYDRRLNVDQKTLKIENAMFEIKYKFHEKKKR